jgi:hypothetical protein
MQTIAPLMQPLQPQRILALSIFQPNLQWI